MENRRQHSRPVIISNFDAGTRARLLTPIDLVSADQSVGKHDELWLQNLIFEYPQILPVTEIEPAFFPLYPVCRELPTNAGYLDNLFVSENGGLTLVECKLWRNPQARREVVGQILDYAKELSQWSYEDLDQALTKSTSSKNNLFEIVSRRTEGLDEAQFVDAVSKNLKRGRFLLLIVGDGIREGVENIANFLQTHAGLNFTFGLVEVGLFKLPKDGGLLVLPRTIAQTFAVERAVITVESEGVVVLPPPDQIVTHKQVGKRTTISEDQFYEEIETVFPGLSKELSAFVEELADLDIFPTFASSSLNLHWEPEGTYKISFGSITRDGFLNTETSSWGTEHIGHVEIAHKYLDELVAIIPGSFVKKYPSGSRKVYLGKKMVTIAEALKVKEQWKPAILRMMENVREVLL